MEPSRVGRATVERLITAEKSRSTRLTVNIVAGLLITTEAMIAEKPKKDAPLPAGGPGGGMGDMDF